MRKDGKSQYQIKKEKLQRIKQILIKDKYTWMAIKAKKYDFQKYGQPKMPREIINEIWEIVRDEKNND